MVMFGCNGKQPYGLKDTILNIESTGEFVCNLSTYPLRNPMNLSSASLTPDTNEFEVSGLEMEPSNLINVPRVKESPIHMECKYFKTFELPCFQAGGRNAIITGQVIGINFHEDILKDGLVDIKRIQPLARMGYMDYTCVEKIFEIQRPND